jgi:hypothetical protein
MRNFTVHTKTGEIPHGGCDLEFEQGGVLVVREPGGSEVLYSPSHWTWVEVERGRESVYERRGVESV